MAASDLHVFYDQDGCTIGGWADIVIVQWATQATLPMLTELSRVADEHARRYPAGYGTVQIIAGRPPLPETDVREKFREILAEHTDRLTCLGVVLEGTGFHAGAVRSFISGLQLLLKQRLKLRVEATVEALAPWVVERHRETTSVAHSSDALRKVLTDVRAKAAP